MQHVVEPGQRRSGWLSSSVLVQREDEVQILGYVERARERDVLVQHEDEVKILGEERFTRPASS